MYLQADLALNSPQNKSPIANGRNRIDFMVFNAVFNSISIISQQPVLLPCFPGVLLILSQTSPGFLRVCSLSLLKTLWEKATSNFSFSHCVFYLFHKTFCHSIKFEIVVCKTFQFGKV